MTEQIAAIMERYIHLLEMVTAICDRDMGAVEAIMLLALTDLDAAVRLGLPLPGTQPPAAMQPSEAAA